MLPENYKKRIPETKLISIVSLLNKEIMDNDPGVIAGIFTYEIHLCQSFPGDKLPG